MVRKGGSSGKLRDSIVTWLSCIASSKADCVFAGARLISSASRRFANTGPRRIWDGYEAAVRAANPDAGAVLPHAIGVRPAAGVTDEQLVEHISLTDEGSADLGTDRGDTFDQNAGWQGGRRDGCVHRRRSSCSKVEIAEKKVSA